MAQSQEDTEKTETSGENPGVNPVLAKLFGGGKAKKATPVKAPAAAGKNAAPAPAAKAQMPSGPLVTIVTRNEFYRDGFRNMIRVAIIQSIIIVGLIMAILIHVGGAKPQDRYFATTADGRIMQLVPLQQANMSTAALMSWVAQAASETMTFGFHDYQRRFQQSSRLFTRRGWETFTQAMQKARIVESVNALKQSVTATPVSAPVLVQQGVFGGKYRWVVKLPLQVNYQSSVSASRVDNLNLHLVIERISSLESQSGVGIAQWIAVGR